jgi:uncharacterized protein (TIGR00297 family)
MSMMNLLTGFLLGALIGVLALWLRALSPSGAVAAAVTGGLIFGLGGIPWAVLLLAFFISSSVLSKMFKKRKAEVIEKFSKGSRRDWGQVLANGGLGAILAVVFSWSNNNLLWAVAFAGAMAAVNADTWATELGVLSRKPPRLISSGKIVEPGTSGGVSAVGTLSALGGAVIVAVLAVLMALIYAWFPGKTTALLLITIFAGLAGSLFDSFLGATIQAIYYCPLCKKETERHPFHLCGRQTDYLRGWRWLDNDLVNFSCSIVGAAIAVGLWLMLF